MSKESKGAHWSVLVFGGFILILVGTFLHYQYKIPGLDKLAEMGIPLDPGKTLVAIGALLIVFPVVNSFYLQPLREVIDERNDKLTATIDEAENLRTEMTQMKGDYERQLRETEEEARGQIQAEVKKAQELGKTLRAEAATQAEEMKQRALQEIEAERQKALGDMRVQVANLSLQATEKILNENMDTERNRKLVDEFLEKAELN